MMREPTASIPGSGWILSHAMQECLELCRPRRLVTSPGIYAFPAGLIALSAVSSPRAAPEWFFLLCLSFAALGLLLAFLTGADLAISVRRYRAEAISFEVAAHGMARAARAMFRAAQMVAIALAIGVGVGLALALPGLAILAAMLTPVLAIAIAALPGALVVPRLADAALTLVVPVSALSLGADEEDRFRMGWRFESRMVAVRAALADRSAPLPSEARDIIKALDGGGMVRPPIARLSVVSVAAMRLRARGLKAVVVAALPVALFVWLVAALMPPGSLSALPRPGDLLQLPPTVDAASPDPTPVEDRTEGDSISGPGPNGAADGGSADGGETGGSDGSAADNAGRDGAGGSAADAGSGAEGEGPSGGAGESGQIGDMQSPRDGESASGVAGDAGGAGSDGGGSDGAGQDGASQAGGDAGSASQGSGQGGSPASDGTSEDPAGQDGASQADGDAGSASDGGGSGSGGTSDGGDGQDGGSQAGGDAGSATATEGVVQQAGGANSGGSRQGMSEGTGGSTVGPGDAGTEGAGDGAAEAEGASDMGGDLGSDVGDNSADPIGAQGPDASTGGDSVSASLPTGSDGPADGFATPAPSGRDGASGGLPADTPPDASETQPGRPDTLVSAEDGRRVLASETGDGAEQRGVAPSGPAAEGGDILSVGTPPSLFAEPGAAPPAVLRDLSPETASDFPPGPAIPPSQRLPAWIANLFQ